MTSYLRKYATALASAKDFISQWSSDHVFADEELIVPFPTLAIFDPNEHIWSVYIKAWIYLPLQSKPLKNYLPPLPNFLTTSQNNQKNNEQNVDEYIIIYHENTHTGTMLNDDKNIRLIRESQSTSDVKVDKKKNDRAAITLSQYNDKQYNKDRSSDETIDSDDESYKEILQNESSNSNENPSRLGLFFVGNSVKIVTKSIINGIEHLLQPSDENGFIEEHLKFSDEEIQSLCIPTHSDCQDKKFDYKILVHEATNKSNMKNDSYKTFQCTIYVPASRGVSIISDIDDTIKISNVLSKRLLLKHTFYSYFEPVEGMNDLYQKWNEQKCQFHYVSAGPWQLYPALRSFLEKYKFPMGTMNLRQFAWQLKFFNLADTYKIETISNIIDAYPLRKYICIGDSGELDPEIYSKLYDKYSQSIVHIFIRDICLTSPCLSACEERYRKTFENIPKQRWSIFKHANEIEIDINKIVSM